MFSIDSDTLEILVAWGSAILFVLAGWISFRTFRKKK